MRNRSEKGCCKLLAYAKSLQLWLLGALGVFLIFCLGGCDGRQKENISDVSKRDTVQMTEGDAEQSAEEKKPVKILFIGDMMFDRYIRTLAEKRAGDYSFIFSEIKDFLSGYDLVIGNLEGPITGKNSVSVGTAMDEKKNLVFSFDPAVAKVLWESNIKLVNLGNNHILNQGEEGLAETEKSLEEAGIEYFGDTGHGQEFSIRKIRGNELAFINYNYSQSGSFEKALGDIKNLKGQSDFVIALPHWGTEYKAGDPGQKIREAAHELVDAGADLVVGTHPHVVQESETYKGKKIYYSLGNFIFDQYFSLDTMRGLAVGVEMNPEGKSMNFQNIPVRMEKRGKTTIEKKPVL
jgi:gamma-polyglutamate biosynthesis protein CapA